MFLYLPCLYDLKETYYKDISEIEFFVGAILNEVPKEETQKTFEKPVPHSECRKGLVGLTKRMCSM